MPCFDEDPNERADVSGADFALMCDTTKRYEAALRSIIHCAESGGTAGDCAEIARKGLEQ